MTELALIIGANSIVAEVIEGRADAKTNSSCPFAMAWERPSLKVEVMNSTQALAGVLLPLLIAGFLVGLPATRGSMPWIYLRNTFVPPVV
ncbi:MAG: hypothetical protein JWQ42_3401 [Edaphobacter sp.]|nr:hypothetical protein [Edaphobacter sp.]